MEHTISGMFNLTFWQRGRITVLIWVLGGVFFMGLVVFFFFSSWGDVLWCILQSLHWSKWTTTEEKEQLSTDLYLFGSDPKYPSPCKMTVCSLLGYLLIFHSSELWISSYFLRGQLSACTAICPADTLFSNVACAIQEQVQDLSWGSLWEGLLPLSCPRKPNIIAIVWMVLFVWGVSLLWDQNNFRKWYSFQWCFLP